MKVIVIGLDPKVLQPDSAVARRARRYASLVDRYDVMVPAAALAPVSIAPNGKAYGSGGGNKAVRLWRLYRAANRYLAANPTDVVSVQDTYYLGAIAALAARRYGCALEVQVHGFEKLNGVRKQLAKFVLRRADAVRTVSERMKKMLVQEFGIDEARLTVVPIQVPAIMQNAPQSGTSLQSSKESGTERRVQNEKKGNFVFLTVGRLVPVKNVGMQIEAAAEAVKTYPNVELWIVGDGPEMQNAKRKMQDLKLQGNVKFLGWQDDVDRLYEQADCFVLTSNSEGWGMVAVEAAAHGLPVIMTDVGLAGEVIKNGESGLVVPVGNVPALAEAMKRLIADEALRQRLGAAARTAVAALPDEAQTLALYRKSWENALAQQVRR